MTLLTRIEKALDRVKYPQVGGPLGMVKEGTVNCCIEAIRHLFAQPPTDEEVEIVRRAIRYSSKPMRNADEGVIDNATRAAITADRGK